jgi:SAM-dependent methyltransferase
VDSLADLESRQFEAQRLGVPDLLNDLAVLEASVGRIDIAGDLLRAVLRLDPMHPDALENLGQVEEVLHPEQPNEPVTPGAAPAEVRFEGHYRDWRRRRVGAIVERYGAEFFRGASVLELGCGYGDIGIMLSVVGADVTFAEGRSEHVEEMRARYPSLPAARFVVYDAEGAWPFLERFDLVLNLGLLYHLDGWERCLIDSLRAADHVVVETEVCDSDDPALVLKLAEQGYDQALSGTGSRPSAAAVEQVIRGEGFRFSRVADSRCNADFHRYDWPVTGSGRSEHGLRRFWFCWRPER